MGGSAWGTRWSICLTHHLCFPCDLHPLAWYFLDAAQCPPAIFLHTVASTSFAAETSEVLGAPPAAATGQRRLLLRTARRDECLPLADLGHRELPVSEGQIAHETGRKQMG